MGIIQLLYSSILIIKYDIIDLKIRSCFQSQKRTYLDWHKLKKVCTFEFLAVFGLNQ